jgi:hypothetical protein
VGSCGRLLNQTADLVGRGHRKGPFPVDGCEDLRAESRWNQDGVHRGRTIKRHTPGEGGDVMST